MPMISPEELRRRQIKIRITGIPKNQLSNIAAVISDALEKSGQPVIDWSPIRAGKEDPTFSHVYLTVNQKEE